jgi:hypothetical protein
MSILSPSPAARCLAGLVGLLPWLCLGGCKHKPAPALASASPSASAELASSAALPGDPEAPSHCRAVPGYALTLAGDSPASPGSEPATSEDDDALLPFGVDIGAAVPTLSGFAVSGIRGAGKAFVALLDARDSRRIDLGDLHGDPETPAVAAAGERVIVALSSSDAAGYTIKLGQIAGSGLEWGYELSKLGKAVSSVGLALAGERGLLVFQGEQRDAEKHSSPRVLLGGFSASDLHASFEAKPVDAKDVEAPRVVARPGGFWLAWVRTLPEPKKTKSKPDAGAEVDPEERDLLELGLRVVEVSKLDEQGHAQGGAVQVGQPRRQVLLFDLAPLASGGLLVATRLDSATPGAEGGALLLTTLAADASQREERLDDDEIGAGAPVLLSDARPEAAGPWLAVSSPSDSTRVGLSRGEHTVLEADPLLGRAELLAVGAGRFLTERARGRGVELGVVECQLSGAAEKK